MQSSDQCPSQEVGHYIINGEMQPHLTVDYSQCSTEQQIAANLLLNYSNQNYANTNAALTNHANYDLATALASDPAASMARVNSLTCSNQWNNNKNNTTQYKIPNILQRQKISSDPDIHNYAFNGANQHHQQYHNNQCNSQEESATLLYSSNLQNSNGDSIIPNSETAISPIKSLKFVAVHLGAGTYCANNHDELKRLAKEVCENIMRLSRDSKHSESALSTSTSKRNAQSGRSHRNYRYTSSKKAQMQESLPRNMDAVTAASQLIKQLEDHHLLNCGYGSNLNMKGHVECDASIMSDKPHQIWTGVGAVSGCKNPILLAKNLYDQQTIPRPLELVQPNFLVGQGAKQWMREHCPQLAVADSQLISQRSLKVYTKLKSQYDETVRNRKLAPSDDSSMYVNSNNLNEGHTIIKSQSIIPMDTEVRHSYDEMETNSSQEGSYALMHPLELDHGFYCRRPNNEDLATSSKIRTRVSNFGDSQLASFAQSHQKVVAHIEEIDEMAFRLDTVGAVAIDCDNNIASAISSGGVLLKFHGRLGQAAVPGAGCWAEESIGVTTSGVGEYLTVTLFAKKIHERLKALRRKFANEELAPSVVNQELTKCFEEELLNSISLTHIDVESKQAGFLAVMQPILGDGLDEVLLAFGHNTNSMCIGFMSANDTHGHSNFSSKDGASLTKPGQAHVETIKIVI